VLETWVTGLRRYRQVRWEIIKRSDQVKGCVILPKRGIVERTCGWLGKYRRLSKDYEYRPDTSAAMIDVVLIHIMVRRIAAKAPF
jgi:putative transposase